jgi:hypothetical protein
VHGEERGGKTARHKRAVERRELGAQHDL